MADTKSSHGLAATGVGTVDYARHDMKRLNSVGDLQKGERYIVHGPSDVCIELTQSYTRYLNMDYLVLFTLASSSVPVLNMSYDIACQWSKNFWP